MKKNIRVGLVCQLANSHDVGQQTVRGIVTNKDSNLFQHQMVCRKQKEYLYRDQWALANPKIFSFAAYNEKI